MSEFQEQHALLLRIPHPKSSACFFRIIDGNLQGKRSQNGILVNGKRCYSHDLHNNDVICFSPNVKATYYQAGQNQELNQPNALQPHIQADQAHLSEAVLIRLSSIPELTPHPIIEMESDGTLIYLNASARKHFPDIDNLNHPVRQNLKKIVTSETQTYYEVREIAVGQKIYEQSIHWLPQSNLIRCYCSEITRRRQMEEAVRHSEERFALAARGANDGLWDWDIENDSLFLSPRWKAMIGYAENELQNNIQEWIDRIHSDDQYQFRQAIYEHLKGRTPHLECEYQLRHKQGHYLYFRCRGIAIFNLEGEAQRIAGSMTDITAYQKAQEKALHDAFHDAMTGLPNRLLLKERLTQALKEYHRNSKHQFALFFLDLDRFKIINDSLGHSAGDQLLIQVDSKVTRFHPT
ncbi:MAG: PAS domain-containing protein, partial [Acaryochloridaceae cyanobacterium RL_2_7]|nr:PAS domain-containing protein [Acaryochloridaceae cyanobacterium RL_2_7]